MAQDDGSIKYQDPPAGDLPPMRLAAEVGVDVGKEFTFYDRVEIGRMKIGVKTAGRLLVRDSAVSSRHCIITQEPDGRCFIRDVSRNGTRVDGRRLSPNLRTEIEVGQVITLGQGQRFRLEGGRLVDALPVDIEGDTTQALSDVAMVTVLVGDIRNYTTMVQDAAPIEVEVSVSQVFQRLQREVVALGGTLKEFQGDAIFAFWESEVASYHAVAACRAALRLQGLTEGLATDRSVWRVKGFPLEMDWALATGPVAMRGHGGDEAVGLAMVGEPVVLAFRIEKLVTEGLGHIIVCPTTQEMASHAFSFESIGTRRVKGLKWEFELFSLTGE